MILSTPHRPAIPVTKAVPFGSNIGNQNLFTIQPGIHVEDALALLSEYLNCALPRPMNRPTTARLNFALWPEPWCTRSKRQRHCWRFRLTVWATSCVKTSEPSSPCYEMRRHRRRSKVRIDARSKVAKCARTDTLRRSTGGVKKAPDEALIRGFFMGERLAGAFTEFIPYSNSRFALSRSCLVDGSHALQRSTSLFR